MQGVRRRSHGGLIVDERGGSFQCTAPPAALKLTGAAVRNARLQILRGAAALSVALYHASILLEQSGRPVFHSVFDGRFGLYGVAVFFAISGSLMANLATSGRPWIFLAHRIIRRSELIAHVGLAFVLSRTVGTPFSFDPLGLTLIPAGARIYPLGVEWTLVFEIAFYVLIFLVMVAQFQRFIPILALVWIGAILLAEGWVAPQPNGIMLAPYLLLLSSPNLAFAGGLLVPFLLRRGFAPVLGLAVFGTVLGYEIVSDPGTERWMGALLATGIVAWAFADRGHARSPAAQVLQRLGDWSYALYLCHVPLILAVYKLWPVQTLGAGAWIAALWIRARGRRSDRDPGSAVLPPAQGLGGLKCSGACAVGWCRLPAGVCYHRRPHECLGHSRRDRGGSR